MIGEVTSLQMYSFFGSDSYRDAEDIVEHGLENLISNVS